MTTDDTRPLSTDPLAEALAEVREAQHIWLVHPDPDDIRNYSMDSRDDVTGPYRRHPITADTRPLSPWVYFIDSYDDGTMLITDDPKGSQRGIAGELTRAQAKHIIAALGDKP
jgi:hypothetical protein